MRRIDDSLYCTGGHGDGDDCARVCVQNRERERENSCMKRWKGQE